MKGLRDVVIAGCVRTAVGDFGGALKDVPLTRLGAIAVGEAVRRAGVPAADVGHVVMGLVGCNEPQDCYFARVSGVKAGLPVEVPAFTVNRQCASGLQAIISAAQLIQLGECDVAVAGGAECMSRAPYTLPDMRWGRRMGSCQLVDTLTAGLEDPFGSGAMGLTAETIAERFGITRVMQDELALESHRRAAKAAAEGRFAEQIVPIEIETRKGKTAFAVDEHVRPNLTFDELARLRPAFKKDGTVTAGNSSGINDGAAALVLISANDADRRGLQPLARIVSWAFAGVDPAMMGLGPIRAVPPALDRAGLSVDDLDVIESNEAFAAQAIAVADMLHFPPEKTNPNGGAVAIGHPIAATGAILTVKAVYELKRGRHGLITMCIGGGQGIALVLERT